MFEAVSVNPIIGGAIAVLGVALGLLLGRFVLPGRREIKRLRGEIEQLGREHAEYRGRVAGHFEKTGALIGQMTASYKAVYDHLADGAQDLCAAEALPRPLFGAPRLIIDESLTVGDLAPRPTTQAETVRLDTETPPAAVDAIPTLEVAGAPPEMPVSNGPDAFAPGDTKAESPR